MWDLSARIWDRSPPPVESEHETSTVVTGDPEKTASPPRSDGADDTDSHDAIDKDLQDGVARVEGITSVWSMNTLIVAYVFIYLIYVCNSLQQQLTGVFRPYVTSSFNLHSLTATTGIVSNLVSGLARLPLSKILDVWGRAEGFCIMVFMLTLGLVMMAACDSVETFCAAQVFYWVGYTGISYVLAVVISDTTTLRNRGLMFGIANTPFIFTTWAGGPAAARFLEGPGWRWGFGSFAIITPIVYMSLPIVFWISTRKASAKGLIKPRAASGRTTLQSIWFYTVELDLFGLLLICAGLSLFLLPASIYSYQEKQWESPLIICFLVFGILTLILFGVWEKFFAPKCFLPMGMLFDRTVFGSCIYAALQFCSFYFWNSFFYSFLIVVNNQTITHASYITNIYSIGSCFWAVIVGLLIRYTGRFKWLPLYFGCPISVLGVALMVVFRQPNVNIGFIIMCQIFIAFGGGTTVIVQQLAATAAVDHSEVAVVLAIQYAFANVGGAIGQSLASAIWTGVMPDRLAKYLPEESIGNISSIYGDMTVQSSYPVGSPTRDAIMRAYGDAQRYMLIGGACFLAVGWFFILIWRDISVRHNKQTKGTVL